MISFIAWRQINMMELDGQEAKRVEQRTWNIFWVYIFSMWYVHTNISAELHMPYACMSKEALKKSCFLRMVEVHPIDLCIVALIRLRKVALQEKTAKFIGLMGIGFSFFFCHKSWVNSWRKKNVAAKIIPFQGLSLFFLKLSINANSSETTSVIYRISFQWTKRVWIHTQREELGGKLEQNCICRTIPHADFSLSIFCFSSAVSEASIVRNELHTHFITPKIPRN